MDLIRDPGRPNKNIALEQNSAFLPALTNTVSLLALVLHGILLRGGRGTFPLQLLTQLELLSPPSLLGAEDGRLER